MPKISLQVQLENIELSKAQVTKMEKEIKAVVASYLGKAASDESPFGVKQKAKPESLGIYIKKFKTIQDLKGNPEFRKYTLKASE